MSYTNTQEDKERGDSSRGKGDYSCGRGYFGRGRGRGFGFMCFQCGEVGHRAFEFPQIQQDISKKSAAKKYATQADEECVNSPKQVEEPKEGESLMMNRVLLKQEKEQLAPIQR